MPETATLLAIDTATGPCSVAVWHGGGVAAYVEQLAPSRQSAHLMPMVEEALRLAGISYPQLTQVVCSTGPGSFTGIRVGLAAARGIAFAAGCAGAGYTTLDVLASGALRERRGEPVVLAVLHAGKGEFYFQAFRADPFSPLGDARLGSLAEAALAAGASVLQCGNAAPASPQFREAPMRFPRADALAELAAAHAHPLPLRPFYIRSPDATLPGRSAKKSGN